MLKKKLWIEKYRPSTIKDVIFQDEKQAKQFLNFVEERNIPNLLLSGVQGTGKTSISKALINDLNIDAIDVLRINCSDEKIDAMRDKVYGFASAYPTSNFNVVQLEEMDYLSLSAQALLRGLIEETSGSCRFIATCNYVNKIIPALRSRFQEFIFKAPSQEKIALRAAFILENENIQFNPEDLINYVLVGYPDIRKIIQLLQQNSSEGKLLSSKSNDVKNIDWKFSLLDLMTSGNLKECRKLVCENSNKEEHEDVYRFLYDNIEKCYKKSENIDEAIIIIADHLRDHSLVADTEINLAACFIKLNQLKHND